MIWLVQKQDIYGQKAEPTCDLAGTERKKMFEQKDEPFCEVVSTEG